MFFAQHAHILLDRISHLPGTRSDGAIEIAFLRQWTSRVRELAAECGRAEDCDSVLAQLFVRGTRRSEGDWPSLEVAAFLEELGTDEFISSFMNSVVYSRGATMSDPLAGGVQERQHAERFRKLAEYVQPVSGKLAEGFREVVRYYDASAKREDDEAQRRRLGR